MAKKQTNNSNKSPKDKKKSATTKNKTEQSTQAYLTADLVPPLKEKVEPPKDAKYDELERNRVDNAGTELTTNQGLKMAEDEFSLKVGQRGPTLLEDFHMREKITHFDHERIPERIVHARGSGAYGEFVCTKGMSQYSVAEFLTKGKKTPVFARFSTVQGSRGSTDTPRDVRGFAVKFYTEQGNLDLVGNNIPVFFIQDAIKFPDFVHALKPEPHKEIPQAASAHDTFWDFVSRNQESAHAVMWAMSDRAIPRSLRMMDGFGVHTFRLVNQEGKGTFVKFHWRSRLGAHALEWDENTKLSGKDPDSQRRDLMDSIDAGDYPVFDFFVQLLDEADEFKYDIEILDATKLWPEELIPLVKVGEMTLNRNVDNFFAEVEQVAFHPGHIVPGIDFTNDPLLQGRLFSYTDTQIIRLGGPNFHQIPVNRPIAPINNNQRDGWHMHMIHRGPVSYQKSAIADESPVTPAWPKGFDHYQEKVEGRKIKDRSDGFRDHFGQAIMFYNSLAKWEQNHITDAFIFELQKVQRPEIRQNVVNMFANVDQKMASTVAEHVGCDKPDAKAGFDPSGIQPGEMKDYNSPALSMANTIFKPDTRKVAVFIPDKTDYDIKGLMAELTKAKLKPELVGPKLGKTHDGETIKHSYTSAYPVMFDSMIVIEPTRADKKFVSQAKVYVDEMYRHFKPFWIIGTGKNYLNKDYLDQPGVRLGDEVTTKQYVDDVTQHRFWERKVD